MSKVFCFLVIFGVWGSVSAKVESDTLEAFGYYKKADSLLIHADFKSSIKYFKEAAAIYKQEAVWLRYFSCLNRISKSYWKWGKYPKSREYSLAVLNSSIDFLGRNNIEEGLAYHNLAIVERRTGSYEESLNHERESYRILLDKFGSKHPHISNSLNTMAGISFRMGKIEDAKNILRKSISLTTMFVRKDSIRISNAFNNLALIHWQLGGFDSSSFCYKQALKIKEKFYEENHPSIGITYNGIGLLHLEKGMNYLAVEYLNNASRIMQRTLDPLNTDVSINFYNLSFAYQRVGNYKKALNNIHKALKVGLANFSNDNGPLIASFRSGLGVIYYDNMNYDSAKFFLKESLQTPFVYDHIAAESYNYLGRIYLEEGQFHKSLEAHTQANKLLNEAFFLEQHPAKAHTLNNMGDVFFNQSDYTKAYDYYDKAIQINTNEGQHGSSKYLSSIEFLRSLLGKAKSIEKSFEGEQLIRLETAIEYYYLADFIIDIERQSRRNYQDKIVFSQTSSQVYEGAVQMSLKLAEITQKSKHFRQAFHFAEKSKAGVLVNALSNLSAKSFGMVPDSLLQLEKTLGLDKTFYQTQIQNETIKQEGYDTAKVARWQDYLFRTDRSTDSLILEMEKNYPKYYKLKYAPKQISIDHIQEVLPKKSALIEYFIGENAIYIFIVSKDKFEVVTLPNEGPCLAGEINGFRNDLKSSILGTHRTSQKLKESSYALFEKYLEPGLKNVEDQIDHLIIVPDGPLSYLPFDILLTEFPDSLRSSPSPLPYLIQQYTIQYGYSAGLLFDESGKKMDSEKEGLLSFAPTYENTTLDSTIELNLGSFRDQVAPLKWNVPEVSQIKTFAGGITLEGSAAKESEFKARAGNHRVIHLAMHALVDDKNPMNSRLMFSQSADSLEDNFLHAYELYNMELTADLAVLSACETGFGKIAKGEGVMSLARAFSYAGCPSVVMSHWAVNDAATAKLMGFFYEFLSKGQFKDEALRNAKLRFLEEADPAQANPYYWGSFVVMGNVEPVDFGGVEVRWYYIGILLLAIAILYMYWLRHR